LNSWFNSEVRKLDQNVQLCTCLLYEQYSRWKTKSKRIKKIFSHSIRVRHVLGLVFYTNHTILQSMGMKMQNPLYLSCTASKANLRKYYPATLWCMWKSHCLWISPRKSHETWWTQMNIMMNLDEDHQERNNILMYSQEYNNILKFRMFAQNFK